VADIDLFVSNVLIEALLVDQWLGVRVRVGVGVRVRVRSGLGLGSTCS
jgi:hypothetical protein